MGDSSDRELDARAGAMFAEVLRRTHLSAAADLGTVVAEEARTIGAVGLVIHLVDYEQTTLVPVPGPDTASGEPQSIRGTVAGRVFASGSILDGGARDGERRLLLPLLDGTERLGVMEIMFPGGAGSLAPALVALSERYAHLIAMLMVAKSDYSDYFELLRRRQPMTMPSELIWELVPPLVLATDAFVLGALMEPCYDIGGDAFDYAVNDGVLHLSVFDAMGHGLAAAGVAAFALSAYRHNRRAGGGPAEAYAAIDAAVAEQYPASRFVTALIAELDVGSGALRWISAGHPAPLLLRAGRIVKTLELEPAPPLGMRLATGPPAEGRTSLEPGDMVLLYTDGLTEARRPGGELFTVERLGEFIERQAAAGEAAPETLRRLREAIIGRREGVLRDDATAVLLEWRGSGQKRMLPEGV